MIIHVSHSAQSGWVVLHLTSYPESVVLGLDEGARLVDHNNVPIVPDKVEYHTAMFWIPDEPLVEVLTVCYAGTRRVIEYDIGDGLDPARLSVIIRQNASLRGVCLETPGFNTKFVLPTYCVMKPFTPETTGKKSRWEHLLELDGVIKR